jgi:hypothetical protein
MVDHERACGLAKGLTWRRRSRHHPLLHLDKKPHSNPVKQNQLAGSATIEGSSALHAPPATSAWGPGSRRLRPMGQRAARLHMLRRPAQTQSRRARRLRKGPEISAHGVMTTVEDGIETSRERRHVAFRPAIAAALKLGPLRRSPPRRSQES